MIRRLIILLLIVGCAPKTNTTFYIGMTEDEFQMKNPNIDRMDLTYVSGEKKAFVIGETATDKSKKATEHYFYIQEKEGLITYLSFGMFGTFIYFFDTEVDTLTSVQYGFFEINYDKYATPPE